MWIREAIKAPVWMIKKIVSAIELGGYPYGDSVTEHVSKLHEAMDLIVSCYELYRRSL